MKVEVFLQARMGSTRLPGKVMRMVLGRPLLDFMIERLRQAKEIDGIAVLTTTEPGDDILEAYCKERGLVCFRGSEDDVLDRYYQAALKRHPDVIVRLTADCPLIDPDILDDAVRQFKKHASSIDYLSTGIKRTFPRGLDVEVFTFAALEKAFYEAQLPEEREHVTLHLYRHPEKFRLKNIAHEPSLDHHRWTVDTPEDFELVQLILTHLYPVNPQFRMQDILGLLRDHPDWSKINAHVKQKPV